MTPLRISLALQGGGAHGAFTWGVLDRLLQDDNIEIAAMSGTSAGALNAAACKAGLIAGGRQGARDSLDRLWAEVASVGDFRMAPWFAAMFPFASAMADVWRDALTGAASGYLEQVYTPYATGAFWRNPLAPVVARLNFAQVCAGEGPALFVAATNVRTGKVRVFSGADVTAEVLLASACLPSVFQAVEFVDPKTGQKEAFWDGGYAANPALFPLYERDLPDDVVVVSINPLRREAVPQQPLDIQNRIDEISFNASLLSELRAVNFVKRLLAEGRIEPGAMKDVRVHIISDEAMLNALSPASKLTPNPAMLARLKAAGQAAAELFLTDHRKDIGQRSSVDLKRLFD